MISPNTDLFLPRIRTAEIPLSLVHVTLILLQLISPYINKFHPNIGILVVDVPHT